MNYPSLYDALHALRRCVWFCFITAPSLVIFFILACLLFNNSLSGQYVESARQLVANAPADKVWDTTCVRSPNSAEVKNPVPVAVSDYLEPKCTPHLRNVTDWQKDIDALIRKYYLAVVLLGLFVWVIVEGGPHISFSWLKRSVKP